MFSSPRLARSSMDFLTTKRLLHEKCQTIEQLKSLIEELNFRHEKKEQELIKHIGVLHNDLKQTKKKMAHLILKYQKQKKVIPSKDFSTQTDDTNYEEPKSLKQSEQYPRYYTLQSNNDHLQYISATPLQPQSDHSLSSPSLSTTDQSSSKHNESSSSAYNTAESLPSSTYSDEIHSLERVLNAACTMYTTQTNLQHTIQLQEELFRQHLRLRGIQVNNKEETASEHFYDNIDSETSDFERQTIACRNRSLPWHQKKSSQRTVRFSLHQDEQSKVKMISKTNDRKTVKSTKKSSCQHHKKLFPSNVLTVTIT